MRRETVCIPVTPDEQVAGGWGKAPSVAVIGVSDGAVTSWRVEPVGWDVLHDASSDGSHHARIVRFVRDNGVTVAVVRHMGEPMQNTLTKLGVRVVLGAEGDARSAAISATS
jgi:predicted Fe-Mo cluster-binding NifX family protein